MISNHGGRQLDGTLAPVDLVARIRDALGAGVELIVDGGVRRGTHVLKALSLGANACSIGRPYLYGLAACGEAGVHRALSLLRDEFVRAMPLAASPRCGTSLPICWTAPRGCFRHERPRPSATCNCRNFTLAALLMTIGGPFGCRLTSICIEYQDDLSANPGRLSRRYTNPA